MRLIDADLLKENCKCIGKFDDLITLEKVIDEQPTVDPVSGRQYVEMFNGCPMCMDCPDGCPFDKESNFETTPQSQRFSEMIKPEENKWVVVRDDDGKEQPFHKWNGTYWYAFIGDDENDYDGWRTDVDVISWKYQ